MKPAENEFFKEVASKKKPKLDTTGKFIYETANERIERAKGQNNPKKLVGSFWKENELMVLFAYTGSGKTAFAQQIARNISEGKSVHFKDNGVFVLQNECDPKKVLYFDAELSDKQFQNRSSSNYEDSYKYSDNYFIMQFNRDSVLKDGESFSKLIIPTIENAVIKDKIDVVIIDNLHCLEDNLEQSKDAKPLMNDLVNIKRKHKVSLMIVGHTPKQHLFQEMQLKDLQGSSAISVQLDTCIAIGNSAKGENIKYLKEVKIRDGQYFFGQDNVITVELKGSKNNLFEMHFLECESESNHLKNKSELNEIVNEATNNGNSVREIAEQTGFSKSHINKIQKVDRVSTNQTVDAVDSVDTKTLFNGT